MADEGEEWIPLREAVAEIAEIYHDALKGDYAQARLAGIELIFRSLKYKDCIARSITWGVLVSRSESRLVHTSSSKKSGPLIPYSFWSNLEPTDVSDWVSGDFVSSNKRGLASTWDMYATGVEILRPTLPMVGGRKALESRILPAKARRGRPRSWDWEGAICAVIARANTPDGLPEGYGAQAEVGRLIGQWFRDNQRGEPAQSEIGARAAKVMAAIEASRK